MRCAQDPTVHGSLTMCSFSPPGNCQEKETYFEISLHISPCGLMDKAPPCQGRDCRFESCLGYIFNNFEVPLRTCINHANRREKQCDPRRRGNGQPRSAARQQQMFTRTQTHMGPRATKPSVSQTLKSTHGTENNLQSSTTSRSTLTSTSLHRWRTCADTPYQYTSCVSVMRSLRNILRNHSLSVQSTSWCNGKHSGL